MRSQVLSVEYMSGLGNKVDCIEWPDLPGIGLSDDGVQYEEGCPEAFTKGLIERRGHEPSIHFFHQTLSGNFISKRRNLTTVWVTNGPLMCAIPDTTPV